VDSFHKFLDGESATFHLTADTEENIKWFFSIAQKDEGWIQVLESNLGDKSFTLNISPKLFPFDTWDCKRTELEGDSSVYINSSIELYKGNSLIDRTTILLNVLPSRPILKEASLIGGEFCPSWMGYYPLATLNIKFSSARTNLSALVKYVAVGVIDESSFPKEYSPLTIIENPPMKLSNDLYEMEDANDTDWGEYFRYYVGNEYGFVWAYDTICTTDLITDPDILEYIEAYNNAAEIKDLGYDEIKTSFKDNVLSIDNHSNRGVEIEIFSLNGQNVYLSRLQQGDIDLGCLVSGIYIAKIKTGNKVITRKIIKQ
jgi:hypothetical protein